MVALHHLLSPIAPDAFEAEYADRRPLHISAAAAPSRLAFGWDDLNGLLQLGSIWTPRNLKLVYKTQPLPPERYCDRSLDGRSWSASLAKIKLLTTQGASLILDSVERLHPALQATADTLAAALGGAVTANVYASFEGVQAFDSHFDTHHVFAVQCDGEKVWTLYANRETAPVSFPADSADTRRWSRDRRGAVAERITMRPGELLYLPRGTWHDAEATRGASLHVTFSVTPLMGIDLFDMLIERAREHPGFRAWLPRPGEDLDASLSALGEALASMMSGAEARREVQRRQARFRQRPRSISLPVREPLTLLRPGPNGAPGDGEAGEAIAWARRQPMAAAEDILAQFDWIDEDDLRRALDEALTSGRLVRA